MANYKTTWLFNKGGSEEISTRAIRIKMAEEFIKCLKEIELLNWKSQYEEPGVLDGIQWSIEIITDGRTVTKQGSNKFPKEWKQFCKAIKKITGKEFR